jgi:hypothetical protein
LWRYGDFLRRQQYGAWFRIKDCIHEFLTDAALMDTGNEYIATATPAGFSPPTNRIRRAFSGLEAETNRERFLSIDTTKQPGKGSP